MNAKTKLIAAVTAFAALAATAAGPWYVAKEDPNAADTLVEGRGTEALPFRTIQAAIDNAAFEAGDTVYVKPGVYDEGMKYDGFTYGMTNRVFITKTVHLKAVGNKSETVIKGYASPQDARDGCGTDSIRCIGISSAATGTTIEGFTFREGRSTNTSGSERAYRRGGGVYYNGTDKGVTVVDCDFIDCRAAYGAAAARVVAIRCLADSCMGKTGASFDGCYMFSCVVVNCGRMTDTTNTGDAIVSALAGNALVVNSTLLLNKTLRTFQLADKFGSNSFEVYNCILSANADDKDNGATVVNTTKASTAAEGKYQVFSPVDGDYRLVSNATAIGFGLASWTNKFVEAGVDAKYLKYDYLGAEIVPDEDGKVNAGAIQATATPACASVEFDSDAYLDGKKVAAGWWRNSEKYPVQYRISPIVPEGSTFYHFTATKGEPVYLQPDGNLWVMPPPLSTTSSQTYKYKFATDVIYVDAGERGSDLTGNGATNTPFKTLQKAMSSVSNSYTVILAEKGRYDSGTSAVSNVLNRVNFEVAGGKFVLLKSIAGPDETFICGAADPEGTGAEDDTPGCGENAVRCVFGANNSAMQGFTLVDGHVRPYSYSDDQTGQTADIMRNGGAVYKRATSSADYFRVMDCTISNCVGGTSIVFSSRLLRCRIVDCTVRGGVIKHSGSTASACLFARNKTHSIDNTNPTCINCTMVGNKKHPSNSEFVGWYNNSRYFNCVMLDPYTTFRVQTSASSAVDNWVWGATGGTGVLTETTHHENPLCADPANGDARLLAFSPAIDSGEHFDTFRSMWWQIGSDMNLAPMRISADGKLTPGCYQGADGFPSVVVVSAPGDGLLVNGEAASATNVVEAGETFNAVLSGDQESSRWCMGVSVDGEERLFDTWPGSLELSFEYSTSPVVVTALYSTNWYVDAVNGSDANRGFTAATAKKTLAEVFTNCAVVAGDVVNALPGTYGEGAMKRAEADTVSARAVVPASVTLRSTSGAANTVIMGGELTRCLFLREKARAEGLTLTGGRVQTASDAADMDRYGGGVRGSAWSDSQTASLPTVTDCIISNNIASRAGGGAYARFVKCRFHGNSAVNDNMSAAGYGTFHHCIVDGNFGGNALMYPYEVYNCTLGPRNYKYNTTTLTYDLYFYGTANRLKAFNSIIFRPNNCNNYCRNCVVGSDNGTMTDASKGEGSILTNIASIALGDDYRPLLGSPAIDMGVPGIGYEGDEWFPETDLGGVQRVMNGGRFDVGAMEHDWRPRYAKDMGGGVCVTDVSTGVVETAGLVVLADGETLGLDWARRRSTKFEFSVEVSGGGTLSVSRDGEAFAEVLAADGVKKLAFTSELAMNRLEFAFSGDGYAALSKFSRGAGVYIVVR